MKNKPIIKCSRCDIIMKYIWLTEKEYYPKSNTPTGRTKHACSHLECDNCGKRECADDSFDGDWR